MFFAVNKEAANAGRVYWKANFPNSGKYQVVDICGRKLIGIGGHKTGRKPLK
jgi:hypothetical protein